MSPSPFATSTCPPGHGTVHLTLLPPATPTFSTLTYAYPLKLLPSTPHTLPAPSATREDDPQSLQHRTKPTQTPLLFLLSYGGGLLPPDHISLHLLLAPHTRLTLTTQGSTKIFPSPPHAPTAISTQNLTASLSTGAGLLLAPDPVQPFRGSGYAQKQVFEVTLAREGTGTGDGEGEGDGKEGEQGASLGVLDWVTEGRRARGESWALRTYTSKLEIWAKPSSDSEPRTLLLRDNIILSSTPTSSVAAKMDHLGVFGTLVLLGPLFAVLGNFFMEEFRLLPRIGGRDWGDRDIPLPLHFSSDDDGEASERTRVEGWRLSRLQAEKADQVLWTAAGVRGCVVVKFGAQEVEGARRWLGSMWREEGTVGREFGEGGLMCVR